MITVNLTIEEAVFVNNVVALSDSNEFTRHLKAGALKKLGHLIDDYYDKVDNNFYGTEETKCL